MILQAAPLNYTLSLAFIATYFSIAYFSISCAFTDTTNIYCSQLRGNNENSKVNLLLRQAMVLQFITFFILCFGGTFVASYVLSWASVDPEVVYMTKMIGISLSPAFICRNITDIIKSLMQVENMGMHVGMATPGAILITIGVSYVLIYKLNFFLYSCSISLLIYEALMLMTVISILFFKLDRKLLDCSIPVSKDFFWFIKECCKTALCQIPSWIANEFVLIFIWMHHNKNHVAAYSVLNSAQLIIVNFSLGFVFIPIIQINKLLGSRDF